MSAYIFLADNETEPECLSRLLFGTTEKYYPSSPFSEVRPGDTIFLYNYSIETLRGPFRALTTCSKDIEKDAWRDSHRKGFPYQVRVSDTIASEKVLPRYKLLNLKFSSRNFPQSKLDELTSNHLIQQFYGNKQKQIETESFQNTILSSHYIFKCNRITGGRVFHENLFGAPADSFRPIVSKIQDGDILFLWLIEERKLYGVWKAISRGQYNPTAFPEAGGKFPAVVYASRYLQVETGMDDATLRSILPYDGNMPPLAIQYDKGEQLLNAFETLGSGQKYIPQSNSTEIGKYKTEDGHWVRSQAEARIDDWLFNHNLTHAYEYRIQKGNKFKKCDFYLPTYNLYIEYWGLIGNPEYDTSRKDKLQFYNNNQLKLVELFPRDIEMLSEVLKPKLASFGVNVLS